MCVCNNSKQQLEQFVSVCVRVCLFANIFAEFIRAEYSWEYKQKSFKCSQALQIEIVYVNFLSQTTFIITLFCAKIKLGNCDSNFKFQKQSCL